MKDSSKATRHATSSPRPLEIALIALPFLSIIPSVINLPALYYNGLPLHETANALMAMVMIGIILIRVIRHREILTITKQNAWLLASGAAFCAWQFVSLLWSPNPAEGFTLTGFWVTFLIFLITSVTRLRAPSAHRLYLSVLAVTLILSLYQLYLYAEYGIARMGYLYTFGLTAELLALLSPIHLTTFLSTPRKWLAAFAATAFGASWLVELILLRRGALAGLVVALTGITLALVFKQLRFQHRRRLIVAATLIVVIGAAQAYSQSDEVRNRIKDAAGLDTVFAPSPETSQAAEMSSLGVRARLSAVALEMVKRNALKGVGAGGYNADYTIYRRAYVESPRYAQLLRGDQGTDEYDSCGSNTHNEYLQVMAETGAVGLILFAAFWGLVVWQLWRRRKSAEQHWVWGAAFGLLAFAISSAVSSFSFRYPPGPVLVASVLGLGLAGPQDKQLSEENGKPILLPRPAALAVLFPLLALCASFSWRSYNVMQSQQEQSQVDMRFFLGDSARNESLLAGYREALATDPYNAGGHLGIGVLLYQMKRPQEAIPHVEYAVGHSFNRPLAYVLLAFCYEQSGKIEQGIRRLEECVAAYPKSVYARAVYAELLRRQGGTDQWQQQKQRLLEINEKEARSWDLALRLKQKDATAEAEKAGLIRPDDLAPGLQRVLVQARAFHYLN
ncbi:MAG TPA: O-antigen ligase family protein [Blastocatellia bacterium]|nr:O-antigen ligase family protein [Blastocatellia bacterium]